MPGVGHGSRVRLPVLGIVHILVDYERCPSLGRNRVSNQYAVLVLRIGRREDPDYARIGRRRIGVSEKQPVTKLRAARKPVVNLDE